MLETNEKWECKTRSDFFSTNFNDPGLRCYPCVEIPLEVTLFHVDVLLRLADGGGPVWRRFMFDALPSVLRFLGRDDVVQARLSVQMRPSNHSDYTIRSVAEIIEGQTGTKTHLHIYRFPNNETYIDSYAEESGRNVLHGRTLWSCDQSERSSHTN